MARNEKISLTISSKLQRQKKIVKMTENSSSSINSKKKVFRECHAIQLIEIFPLSFLFFLLFLPKKIRLYQQASSSPKLRHRVAVRASGGRKNDYVFGYDTPSKLSGSTGSLLYSCFSTLSQSLLSTTDNPTSLRTFCVSLTFCELYPLRKLIAIVRQFSQRV